MAMEFQLHGPKELATFVPLPEEEKSNNPGTYASQESEPEDMSEEESEAGEEEGNPVEEEMDHPAMGLTENKGATFLTSGSHCLDFFFQIVPPAGPYDFRASVKDLLPKAWKEDPLLALKLVFQLRGVRGSGKSDKLNFYEAACWLYEHHPATLAANTSKVPKAGYYKDLLELLRRILEGPEETRKRGREKLMHKTRKETGKYKRKAREAAKAKKMRVSRDESSGPQGNDSSDESEDELTSVALRLRRRRPRSEMGYFHRKGAAARAAKKDGTLKPREERVAENLAKGKADKEAAAVVRKDKHLKLAKRVVERHRNEPKFAALYNAAAEVFAKDLAKDLEALNKDGRKARISLAAKWCPSLDSSYDRHTLLCEAIACMLFPKSTPELAALDHHHYVSIVRDKLRKEVLVPLRKALELPEVYMAAKKWHSLPYNRVASVAMKRYKELFIKKDEERFKKYLDKVESGKAKIAAGALLPHEILMGAVRDSKGEGARVAELQWKAMVEELKQKGCLTSSLSICDVSGSMHGTPMEVCIALGMLTAELSDEPWKGKLMTFSNEPMLHAIQGETLAEKYKFTSRMPWDGNTDFQKVFDRILELARESNLPPNRMVKRLFVYSDMEFDQVRGSYYHYDDAEYKPQPWETDYMQICRKFREAGYGSPPQIVFWNLRPTESTPVTKDQPGVALVSGFSKNLLKMFMENDGEVDPMFVLKQAITGDFYDELVVVD